MRADRLIGVLLFLQRRGQVTATEVAAEFEISERTARRDLDALGMAGFPVYSIQGRGGGWRLLGDARTDLSGLSAAEVRALFLLAGPSATATGEIRSALRKLASALPDPLRASAETAADAVLVDAMGWTSRGGSSRPDPSLLDAVQEVVVERRRAMLDYVDRDGATSRRTIDPLGLVTKGGTWYLIAGTDAGQRTFRVDRVRGVEPTGEEAVRPDDFDLAEAWASVVDRMHDRRLPVAARGRADVGLLPILRYLFGDRLVVGDADDRNRVAVEIRGQRVWSLAVELAGFGAAIEFHDPPEMRKRLAEIGQELVHAYD